MAINKNNISETNNGLHTDTSAQNQPKGTYRFALNTINETDAGDEFFRSNEESNEKCYSLTPGFIPIGKCYIGGNETILFSVSQDNIISEIGILKNNCNYEVHVNDEFSSDEDKLGFTVENQIQATYRLRRGCERTTYFTDDNRKPRYYNFDKPADFKNDDGTTWAGKKFNLFKEYNEIPTFQEIKVLNSGGVLEPGSYNIAVQYVDKGLNASEWITTSDIINIYNSSLNEDFLKINGSINSDTDYINFPATNKSIRVTLTSTSLDDSYDFYRLAFIEATNGSGNVSGVKYTEVIPISKNYFIYTGENAVTTGTQEEILFFNEIIYKAQSIEQIENRLILANTEGKQVNFCKLQQYASRIKADCTVKQVILNDINHPLNTKNPNVHNNGTGYMPGEIYSFGIVYVFEDGSLSPVYHIPGKNPNVNPSTVYSQVLDGDNNPTVFPMNNNNLSSSVYKDNDSCNGSFGYFGFDSEGETLIGKPVRHHRFPLRTEINKPLVKEFEEFGVGEETTILYHSLQLTINGTLKTPIICDVDDTACTPQSVPDFSIKVSYTLNGEDFSFVVNINPAFYSDNTGTYELELTGSSTFHDSNNFTNIVIEETDINGNLQPAGSQWCNYFDCTPGTGTPYVGPMNTTNSSYTVVPQESSSTIQGKLYSTEILGIKFSGIDIPSLNDTNGEKIIGYYIVRNERTENEKTIIDSAVLTPSLINSKYIGNGLLQPEVDSSRISKNVYGLIHPEHKFNNREYTEYDEIIHQGNFDIIDRKKSKIIYNDVLDGSSYDGGMKSGNDDGESADDQPRTRGFDGWSLTAINRDNITRFNGANSFNINEDKIKDTFYLKALESKDIEDNTKSVYNIAADNKVGIIQFKEDSLVEGNLPYVLLKRNILDSYSTYRTLPYYKETENYQNITNDTCSVFNGDSYITPMRYVNTMFWDNRIAKRKVKGSRVFGTDIPGGLGKWIAGAILIALGTILLAAGVGVLVIGAGIAVIGGGALFIASGVEAIAVEKAYLDAYDKGLRSTALDNFVDDLYNFKNLTFGTTGGSKAEPGNDGPSDDTIEWVGDCITDLWFESSINTSLRNKMVSDAPTFLDAPGIIESGNNTPIVCWEFYGLRYTDGNAARYPVSKLDNHIAKKLLVTDQERNDSKFYIGLPLGEYYQVNPDYHRKNKEKIFYHLPLEYECCSNCQEDFPHRWHWSEQSFQEELTDNYRVFLPNNYKDLEGETGEITNVFKIGNNLFMHTKEALWQIPRNYQERVTDQIVSFIGTGTYGEIPAQKVLDDDTGSSAGSQHKWGLIKTPNGVFFPSENQRKIYQFDGKQLQPISSNGNGNWFQKNMELLMNKQYYDSTSKVYPYNDNPSNPFGTGFISTYDTKKERIIFTKKDFLLNSEVTENPDFEVCINNGQVIYFPNYNQIIQTYQTNGWSYVGIENCKMKFSRDVLKTRTEIREITTVVNVSNKADIHVFYDTSGSFDGQGLQDIRNAVADWVANFAATNTSWTGNLYEYNNGTERWVNFLEVAIGTTYSGVDLSTKDVILVTFVNESKGGDNTGYHGGGLENPINGFTGTFQTDYNTFVSRINTTSTPSTTKLNSFIGVNYPIAFSSGFYSSMSKCYVEHCLAAIQGAIFTATEAAAIPVNPGFTSGEWGTMLAALQGSNPYSTLGTPLRDYGWRIIPNRYWDGFNIILTSQQFQDDITALLAGFTQTIIEEVETDVTYVETEYQYIDGTVVEDLIELNNSWTMSYSLKQNSWVSWHSYLPNFYINVPEKFYSWIYGNNNIWKHNKEGHYQTFYDKLNPFILEYVSLSNPLTTRLWEYLLLLVEVKKYNNSFKEFTDINDTFFNKLIAYNSRQCSGLMNIKVKNADEQSENYLYEQISNLDSNEIIVDRNERDWTLNNLRDIRTDYSEPIFISDLASLQTKYFIDKILNNNSIDYEKDWSELESFRDKYLVVRLIFDNFAQNRKHEEGSIKMIMNFSGENETQSFR